MFCNVVIQDKKRFSAFSFPKEKNMMAQYLTCEFASTWKAERENPKGCLIWWRKALSGATLTTKLKRLSRVGQIHLRFQLSAQKHTVWAKQWRLASVACAYTHHFHVLFYENFDVPPKSPGMREMRERKRKSEIKALPIAYTQLLLCDQNHKKAQRDRPSFSPWFHSSCYSSGNWLLTPSGSVCLNLRLHLKDWF